jgi:hypothetical protein
MNVDLSRQDIALIVRRFDESEQQDIDEQALGKRLKQYLAPQDNNLMRKYQINFKTEVELPPLPHFLEKKDGEIA